MKYIVALLMFLVPLVSAAEDKFLNYRFNENVIITISNVTCKVPGVDGKKFPNAAVAKRIDGQFLFGCFTHEGDTIIIQWAMGDQSRIPANYFLAEKLEPNT